MGVLSIIGVTPNPVREGQSTTVTAHVRYTPDPVNDLSGAFSFALRVRPGTATADADFVDTGRALFFSTGPSLNEVQDFFVAIPIQDDAIVENPETFVVEISNLASAPEVASVNPGFIIVERNAEVVTILDNDSPDQPAPLGRGTIRFEFANYVVVEGQPFIEARVIREGGQFGVIQGEVAVQFGTAEGADINDPGQTSIFFGDQDITPKIIRIPIIEDNIPEPTEQFTLVLTERRAGTDQNVSNATNLVVDRSVVQIQDNDGSNNVFPTISLAQSIINVAENAGFIDVPIDVIFPPGGRVAGTPSDYTIEITAGTATAGSDFTAVTRTFNFAGANQSFRENIRIPILNDTIAEGLETLSVRITTSNGAFVGNAATIVNIIDDDVSANISLSRTELPEGATLNIRVTPNGVFEPGEIRTVTINTQDITAKLGEDFRAPNFSPLTFTFDNSSPQVATIDIVADQIPEQNETFRVVASGSRNLNGVTLPLVVTGDSNTVVTISNLPAIKISSVTPSVTEGLDRFAQVLVERLGDVSRSVGADLSIIPTGENGAQPGRDFADIGTVSVNFLAGDSTPQIISIPIIDNDLIQNSRSFLVQITNAETFSLTLPPIRRIITLPDGTRRVEEEPNPDNIQAATIATLGSPTIITINDNDGPNAAAGTAAARGSIQFERASYVVSEGQAFLDIRVQRVGGTSGSVSAEVTLGEASGTGVATAGSDFITPAQTSIFFADGVGGFQTIRIPIINDFTTEPTESFSLNLVETRGEQTLTVNSTVIQITDNDGDQTRNFGTVGFGETTTINVNEGAGSVTIPIKFSGAAVLGTQITINYTVVGGDGEGLATSGEDFFEVTAGNISFPSGTASTTIPITIPIIDDRKIEITERFVVSIDSVQGALPGGTDRVVVNIIDNDGVGDGEIPAVDTLASPFFSPITVTTQTAPFLTTEAVNPPAIPTDFSDTLLGTNDAEAIAGGKGNDTIDGRGGNDSLYGGEGQDILFGGPGRDFLFGNAGDDVLNGGDGDDLLFGGKGNDALFGNEGNDFLAGDLGNDFLVGGGGADRFALQVNGGVDTVSDFSIGQDFIVLTEGLQFNQLSLNQVGANTVIRVAGQDVMILTGVVATNLTPASFLLG